MISEVAESPGAIAAAFETDKQLLMLTAKRIDDAFGLWLTHTRIVATPTDGTSLAGTLGPSARRSVAGSDNQAATTDPSRDISADPVEVTPSQRRMRPHAL